MGRRVAVAFNDDASLKSHLNPTELVGELEVVETAQEIAGVLSAELVPVRDDITSALNVLRRFDLVVDLCEGVLGNPRYEKNFAMALEMLGIPHTSCDPIAVGLCIDKRQVKRLLHAAGLPAPRFWRGERGTFIVKPALEDAGIGIDAAAVLDSPVAIEQRAEYVRRTYGQPALVEEFIDGRELNQSIYCDRVLPPGEVVFGAGMRSNERVVGWKAKWDTGSAEDLATVNRTPAEIDQATKNEIARICTAASDLFGTDMVVRFDLRQAQTGQLSIIDINPNPDLGRDAGFRRALAAAGISFADFLNDLIIAAYARQAR